MNNTDECQHETNMLTCQSHFSLCSSFLHFAFQWTRFLLLVLLVLSQWHCLLIIVIPNIKNALSLLEVFFLNYPIQRKSNFLIVDMRPKIPDISFNSWWRVKKTLYWTWSWLCNARNVCNVYLCVSFCLALWLCKEKDYRNYRNYRNSATGRPCKYKITGIALSHWHHVEVKHWFIWKVIMNRKENISWDYCKKEEVQKNCQRSKNGSFRNTDPENG